MNKKEKTARLSIISNTLLILLKLITGFISGSVSIISEAIHSGIDLIAAIIAFFSVKIASKPPDKEHPYGHGKFENISGLFEVILIIVAAIFIIYESVNKLISGSEFRYLEIGFAVMLFSALINYLVSARLYKVAKEFDSVALEADALHLRTDVFTSLGVAVGILIIYLSKISWLDPLIAIFVALYILTQAFKMLKKVFDPLVDSQLPESDLTIIKSVLDKNKSQEFEYKQIRTRKSGSEKYLDFQLHLPGEISVQKAHDICDAIENEIMEIIPNIDINIHIEPRK